MASAAKVFPVGTRLLIITELDHFLEFLSHVTGISNLISDPRSRRRTASNRAGGKLGVHAASTASRLQSRPALNLLSVP